MPAEVDLLCEYYISSNLNSKKHKGWSPNNITSSTSNNTLNGKLSYSYNNNNNNINNDNSNNNKNHTNGSSYLGNNNSNNQTQNLNQYDTIDFVKYEKNPLSILKTKYKTLGPNSVNTAIISSSVNTKQTLNISSNQPETDNTKNDSSENNQQIINKNSTTSASNGFKNNNNSQLLELNWSKIRKIGIGLLNLGNNCYLNATLQCLAYTPPFSQWLVSRPHTSQCKFKQFKGFCSLCEVERIVFDIFNSGNGFAKPNTLCYNIKKISNVFGVGTQEDASEFFTTLLESMAKSIRFSSNSNSFNKSEMFNNKKNMKSSIPTILDDIFSFQFRSRITCGNCGRLSDTIENTNTWPIDVKFVQDIRKGMLHFLRQEVLEGENSYKCDKCNKKTRATKQYSIRTAPNILVVHLKRFDFSFAGKLSHFVQYPETLSLKTLIPDAQTHNPSTSAASMAAASLDSSLNNNNNNKEKALRNVTYKLYGVLVHLGHTSHSGHYYSYVRGPNDQWYKADDTRVSIVQSSVALAQNAYILFYNKITSQQNVEVPQRPQQQVNSLNSMNNSLKQQMPHSISESNIFKLPQNKLTQNIETNINSSQPILNEQDRPKINPFQINGSINVTKKITISNGHLDLNGKINNDRESSDLSLKRKLQDETNGSNSSTSLPKIYSYNGLSNILNNRPKIISESSSPIKTSNLNGNIGHQEKEKILEYGPQLPSKTITNGHTNGHGHANTNGHLNGSRSGSKKESSEESSSDNERKKDIIKSNKLKLKKLLKSVKNLKKINDKSMKASKKMKKKKIKFLRNLLKDKKLLKLYRDKTSDVFKRVKKLKKLVKKNKSNNKSSSSKERESNKYSSNHHMNGTSPNSDYKLMSSYSNSYYRSIPIATSV